MILLIIYSLTYQLIGNESIDRFKIYHSNKFISDSLRRRDHDDSRLNRVVISSMA